MKKTPLLLSTVGLAVSLGLGVSGPAHADTLNPFLFTTQNAGEGLSNGPFTLGWDFTTNGSITVTALGAYDSSQDGLAESHEVGIWNSSGTLLASTTVASGTTDALVNQFRYSSITAITLAANQTYFIGAVWLDGADPNVFAGDSSGITTDPLITYGTSTYAAGGTLTDPTAVDGTGGGYLGPDFAGVAATPLPSTWTMLIAGFIGLGFFAHRSSKKNAAAIAAA